MRLKASILPALAAIAIILSSGYVHGVYSFRWSAANEIRDAVAKLGRVPIRFGNWIGEETALDERQSKMAQIEGSVSRRYVNDKTGQAITIMLVCGRPGPISAHTPDLCYSGAGFLIDGERAKVAVDFGASSPAEFWAINVTKSEVGQNQTLAIDYSWYANGAWAAPAVDARLQFAGYPVLFKLYAIREVSLPKEQSNQDPTVEFLKEFLSVLNLAFADTTN